MKSILLAIAICVVGGDSLIGHTAESSYPGLPFGNVKIGISKKALQTMDKNIKFLDANTHRPVGLLKKGGVNFIFYFKEDKLFQVAYGWEGLKEEDQKIKTHQLLNEFAARFGSPVSFERTRLIESSPVAIAARKYSVSPSDVAVLESWEGTISIIITTAHQWAETERNVNLEIRRLQNKKQVNENAQRPGVVDFWKKKNKPLKEGNAQQSRSKETLLPNWIKRSNAVLTQLESNGAT